MQEKPCVRLFSGKPGSSIIHVVDFAASIKFNADNTPNPTRSPPSTTMIFIFVIHVKEVLKKLYKTRGIFA